MKRFFTQNALYSMTIRGRRGGGGRNRKKERIFIYGMECCTYHVLSLCFLVSKTACCFCIFATPLLELLHLGAVLFPEKDFIFRDLLYLGFWFNDSLYHKTKVNACVECSGLGIFFCPFELSHTLSSGEIPSWFY